MIEIVIKMNLKNTIRPIVVFVLLFNLSCNTSKESQEIDVENPALGFSENILDYHISPKDAFDRSGLMFSDQGAWFAYGLHKEPNEAMGFSGPFIMTQQNGIWLSASLLSAMVKVNATSESLTRNNSSSDASHLENSYSSTTLQVNETLIFKNGHTALLRTQIKNIGIKTIDVELLWGHSPILIDGILLSKNEKTVEINSKETDAKGYISFPEGTQVEVIDSLRYNATNSFNIKPNETKEIVVAQTFIFPEYSWEKERQEIHTQLFDSLFNVRKDEKSSQLKSLIENRTAEFKDDKYAEVLAKAH
jgi:putative isomerase